MKRCHRLLLSVLSGVLLSLPWFGLSGWFAFVALLPLLFLNHFFVRNKSEFLSVSFWGHALLMALVWNILSVWWIAIPMFTGSIFVIASNSLLMSIVLLLAHLFYRKWGEKVGNIALVVFWLSFEMLHYHWDVDFPWLNLGNAFARNIKVIQWYELTGVLGGSLWILLVNLLLFQVAINLIERKLFLIKSIVCVVLIVVPLVISIMRFNSYKEKVEPFSITLVQTSINPYSEKFDLKDEQKKAYEFFKIANSIDSDGTELFVGSETLFENANYWDENKFVANSFIARFNSFLVQKSRADLLIGTTTIQNYQSKKKPTTTARFRDGNYYDQFNTALFLQPDKLPDVYHKSRLVGGVEKMPFQKYLFFLDDLTFDLGGSTGSLGTQKAAENFIAKDSTVIAPVICYESVFGDYVGSFVKKGAQILCIITNDGWWNNSMAYNHLLWYAQLRAIETRRSVARCANYGISCFINQRGEIEKYIERGEEGALTNQINKNSTQTFYVKHGNYIGRLSLIISVLMIGIYIVTVHKRT